jgi:PKHD-type hydroxylase
MFTIPKLNTAIEPLICWSGAFTDEEVAKIVELGDKQTFMEAKVGTNPEGEEKKEISQIAWFHPSKETEWIFRKVVELVAQINHDKYQFDLNGIDAFQYTTYSEGGYYKWHVDSMHQMTYGDNQRKLGVSIVLNDPDVDYTGGMFQFIPGGNPDAVEGTKVKKGDVLVFPSFIPHQVDTVTSGKRKSLVCWVAGPKFK